MISIIIPIMRVGPYPVHLKRLLPELEKQRDVETEILVEEQPLSDFIYKNKLLNQGFAKSKGEFIWFCDADFMPSTDDLLARMKDKCVSDDIDLIWPMYWSSYKYWKASDGGVFMKREVLELHGPLDESLKGVSLVTFPFAKWCLDNVKYFVSPEFTIKLQTPTYKGKKIDFDTYRKHAHLMQEFFATLQEKGMNKIKPDVKPKRQVNMP